MKNNGLFSVSSDTFPKCFFAWKSVIQRGNASFMGYNTTCYTFHPEILTIIKGDPHY